jgi:UDP-glucose:(heptosyl)LPS alpha-1,3-glucosyltransferase
LAFDWHVVSPAGAGGAGGQLKVESQKSKVKSQSEKKSWGALSHQPARASIAVVSPFIDKSHGTERHLAELLPRLADNFTVRVYSQNVADVDLSKITWQRIPRIPGPHLMNYLWWFAANHLYRWRDRRLRGLRSDLLMSPGVNCLDADLVSVHVVFANLYQQTRASRLFRRNRVSLWPRLLHRLIYYKLIMALERRVYSDRSTAVSTISRKTADDLKRLYGREGNLPVIYAGIEYGIFNPQARTGLRNESRAQLGLAGGAFVLLLIGNGWQNKGLASLIDALRRLAELDIQLLVVGQDDPSMFQRRIRGYGLGERVRFLPPRPDVVAYYAAADVYVGPSLEDAFAQPPAEAMACGLPAIVSSQAGISEILTDGVDGLILKNPQDDAELAALIEMLYRDAGLRQSVGEAAARTARRYTWDRNAEELGRLFKEVIRRKQAARCTEKKQTPEYATEDVLRRPPV